MSYKNKKEIIRIFVAAVLFIVPEIFSVSSQISFAMYLTAYLIIGYDILFGAIRNIFSGQIFDENFLMTVATLGAFVIAKYPEAVAVMLFFQIGELFQNYAVNKSRKSIQELMDIKAEYANVELDGIIEKIEPNAVKVGDVVVINPGERVPLDGVVINGASTLDASALTGESLPREVEIGSEVLSGCINLNGVIKIKVEKEYSQSAVNRILDLVENASNKKSKSEKFITKFAKYYTPIVVILALCIAILPPLLIQQAMWQDWIYRALTFLVISCPCALVISVPLSFFGGIGGASAKGVLIKGSNYLEALAKAKTIVFDKTGTLTKGEFKVVNVVGENVLQIAAAAEKHSGHPISECIKKAVGRQTDIIAENVKEQAGYGVVCTLQGVTTLVGNAKLLKQHNINFEEVCGSTIVYVAQSGKYIGYIEIEDTVKEDAKKSIEQLKDIGVQKTVMLTGDAKLVGENISEKLGLDVVFAELLPYEKVEKLEQLLNEKKSKEETLCYVGDGINDAPVIARADVGIAMGAMGSDAAIEAADVVIMDDKPSKIVTAIKISRKTLAIVKQNVVFALGVKIIVLILGAFGDATMWEAVFADVGVSVIAILNAMRALNTKKDVVSND